MTLPDSVPSSLWEEFKLHRKKLRAPMTEHAETLILAKLEKWKLENGANPIDVINESIEKGWRGVFLNGHGTPGGQATGGGMDTFLGRNNDAEMRKAPKPVNACCDCGKLITGSWIYTIRGRSCCR